MELQSRQIQLDCSNPVISRDEAQTVLGLDLYNTGFTFTQTDVYNAHFK